MTDDERRKLVSTETSLAMGEEPRLPAGIAGLENFSLTKDDEEDGSASEEPNADTFFNLPNSDEDDDEDDQN